MSLDAAVPGAGAQFASAPYLLDRDTHRAYNAAIEAPARRRPRASIHDDPAAAREAGYAAPIADGEQVLALAARLLCERFGMGFLRGGSIEVAFIKPVYFGTTLVAHARVTAVSGGVAQLDVWVSDQSGEKVMLGSAAARIGAEPR